MYITHRFISVKRIAILIHPAKIIQLGREAPALMVMDVGSCSPRSALTAPACPGRGWVAELQHLRRGLRLRALAHWTAAFGLSVFEQQSARVVWAGGVDDVTNGRRQGRSSSPLPLQQETRGDTAREAGS